MDTLLVAVAVVLFVLLGIVFFLGSAVGVVKRLFTPRLQDHPTCGYCGYIIQGIASPNCPECGCDFQIAGVRPPKSIGSGDSWEDFLPTLGFYKQAMAPLLIYTLILMFLSIAGALLVNHEIWPSHKESRFNLIAQPQSRGYRTVSIFAIDRRTARGDPDNHHGLSDSRTALVELQTTSALHSLKVDLLNRSYSYTDSAGQTTSSLVLPAKEDVIAFIQSAGVIVDREAASEAAAIANLLATMATHHDLGSFAPRFSWNHPLQVTRLDSVKGNWTQHLPLPLVALVLWAALWLLGILTILWRRRHSLGPAPRVYDPQLQPL
jgi:hypothetical protein